MSQILIVLAVIIAAIAFSQLSKSNHPKMRSDRDSRSELPDSLLPHRQPHCRHRRGPLIWFSASLDRTTDSHSKKCVFPFTSRSKKQPPPNSRRFSPHWRKLPMKSKRKVFEYVSDSGWNWETCQPVFNRIFLSGKPTKMQAHNFASPNRILSLIAYITLNSRNCIGTKFTERGIFPFSNTMKTGT